MKKQLSEEVESRRERRKRTVALTFYECKRAITQALFGRFGQKRILSVKANETLFICIMLLLPTIHFLMWYVYVSLDSITMGFRNIDFSTGKEYWTLDNFKNLAVMFREKASGGYGFGDYLLNTLKYWSINLLWGYPHSILLSYAITKKVRGHKFFRVALYLPSMVGAVVLAGLFEAFISKDGVLGYIGQNFLGIENWPMWFQDSRYAMNTLIFYGIFMGWAGSYVLLSGAIAKIPDEVLEAATMDGITMWKEIRYIIIPLIWPSLSMMIIGTFTGLLGASGAILLFTPDMRSTWSLSYWIFDQVKNLNSYYLPSALGLIMTCICFPIGLLVKKLVFSIWQDVA